MREHIDYDFHAHPEPVALNMLRMVTDDSHIVYSSDFPHSPAKVIAMKKKHFDENRKQDAIRERIYRENGMKLLKGVLQAS